jgi:hypothetical protein
MHATINQIIQEQAKNRMDRRIDAHSARTQ